MDKVIREIKCKDCIFYSGIKCHGHGEYWGECNLLINIRKILANLNNAYEFDLDRIGAHSCWDDVLSDGSSCMFFIINEFKKE